MFANFPELVRQARSYRRFDERRPVSEAELRDLVDTARLVPCGGNKQPLRYRLVHGAECNLVFPHIAWAGALKDWDGPAPGERPTGYVVVLYNSARGQAPGVDVGIAAQTIQLAATAAGLGACMLGAIRRTEIHDALELPDDLAIALMLAIGRPAETVVLEDMVAAEETDYYRTMDGVHHVPKRALDTILVTAPVPTSV